MFRSFERALESIDSAFASPTDQHHVNRIISVERLGRVRLGPVFAEGGFSFLHTAEVVDKSELPLAAKLAVKRLSVTEPDALRRARAEATLLASLLPHPNIVTYHGSSFAPPDAFLVFELVDGGSLADYLDRRKASMSPELALNIFSDVLSAVVHLHAQSPPVAFRDLKLENVLWDRSSRHFKLCDFGSATTVAKRYVDRRELQLAEDEIREHSSAMYRAPELVDLYSATSFVCERVDVWAAGCVWYAILYDALPFDEQSTIPILQGRISPPASPSFPGTFTKLLTSMLTVDVAKRADSFRILEAVCRLRGTAMDPNLRLIGEALRDRREQDCARTTSDDCDTPWKRLAVADSPNVMPTFGSGGEQPLRPRSAVPSAAVAACAASSFAEEEEDWADFESAAEPRVSPATPSRFPRVEERGSSLDKDERVNVFRATGVALDGGALEQQFGGKLSLSLDSFLGGTAANGAMAARISQNEGRQTAETSKAISTGDDKGEKTGAPTEDLFSDLLPSGFK